MNSYSKLEVYPSDERLYRLTIQYKNEEDSEEALKRLKYHHKEMFTFQMTHVTRDEESGDIWISVVAKGPEHAVFIVQQMLRPIVTSDPVENEEESPTKKSYGSLNLEFSKAPLDPENK